MGGRYAGGLSGTAYNLIWNEWFRDENLQNSVVTPVTDGPDNPSDFVLLRRGKRHDYFTSSLPWPQKGPSVPLPLTGNATVKRVDSGNAVTLYNGNTNVFPATGGLNVGGTPTNFFRSSANMPMSIDPNGSLYADLTTVTVLS